MVKKSPGVIEGAQEQSTELERYLVMGLASKLHWTNHKILRECAWLGKDMVQRWAARGRAGWQDASNAERPGRPPIISGAKAKRLQRALANKRFATPARLAAKFGASKWTLRRSARREKLVPVKVSARCRLSEAQRLYRLEWCRERKNKDASYWERWVWSDEKWFYLVCKKSGEYVWVYDDDMHNECRYIPRDKHPTKVLVWAAISASGRSGLHVFPTDAKVDAVEYQYCMDQCLLPAIEDPEYLFPDGVPDQWVYMQDGAPGHRAKSTTDWLREKLPNGCKLNDGVKWPAGSPDLNPIENLWNFFQNKVVDGDPKTFDEFKNILVDCWWQDISQEYIRNLYASMPRRIEAVLSADGKMTKY